MLFRSRSEAEGRRTEAEGGRREAEGRRGEGERRRGGTNTGGNDLRQAQRRMRGEPGRVLRQGRPSFPGDRAVGTFRDLQRRLCRRSLMLGVKRDGGRPQSLPWKASPLPRHELFPEARESLSPWL